MKSHGHSSGKLLQADNARHLGLPQATVDAWRDGSELTLNAEPQSYYRRPYSSVYDSLDTLMQVCRETLMLIKLPSLKISVWLLVVMTSIFSTILEMDLQAYLLVVQ